MPNADRFVVDSNVVLKWYAPNEPHTDKAIEIRDLFLAGLIDLHAPLVLYHEVGVVLARWGNGLRRKIPGAAYMTVAQSREILFTLWRMGLHLAEPSPGATCDAVRMSVDYSKGFKDMLFLQLAKELDCRLITSDRRIIEGVPRSFPRSRVVLLSEW